MVIKHSVDHLIIYANNKSLYSVPKTNMMLYT